MAKRRRPNTGKRNAMQAYATRARHVRKGPSPAICLLCPCSEVDSMRVVTGRWLDAHHVVGWQNDPDLCAWLCHNCHDRIGKLNAARGVPMHRARSLVEQLAVADRGTGLLLVELGKAMVGRANEFDRIIAALDLHDPSWRDWPEFQ